MRSLQQTLTLLLLLLTASGCGLPSRAGRALQSVVRTSPAVTEADSGENRELLAGLRMKPRTPRGLVGEVSEPATIAKAAEGHAPETGLVIAEASEIKARLEQIRARAAARSQAPESDKTDAARPVILVSNAERRRARLESEATADWSVEREAEKRDRPPARAATQAKQKVASTVKRGSAWFDVSRNTPAKSSWDSADSDSVWDLDADSTPFGVQDAEW